jgi:hypothetical protein
MIIAARRTVTGISAHDGGTHPRVKKKAKARKRGEMLLLELASRGHMATRVWVREGRGSIHEGSNEASGITKISQLIMRSSGKT